MFMRNLRPAHATNARSHGVRPGPRLRFRTHVLPHHRSPPGTKPREGPAPSGPRRRRELRSAGGRLQPARHRRTLRRPPARLVRCAAAPRRRAVSRIRGAENSRLQRARRRVRAAPLTSSRSLNRPGRAAAPPQSGGPPVGAALRRSPPQPHDDPQRRRAAPEGTAREVKPAATYSPRPLRAKYHRR